MAVTAAPRSGRPCLAVGGCDHDVAAKADNEVEFQLVSQHLVQLVIAEATIGNNAYAGPCRDRIGQRLRT